MQSKDRQRVSSLSGSTFYMGTVPHSSGEVLGPPFTVADEHGGVAREIIIITVDETNQAPELADVGNQNADVDKVLTIILEGTDADGDELTYSVEGEPTGASLAEQTFSWKPSSAQVGTYEVTFTVEGRSAADPTVRTSPLTLRPIRYRNWSVLVLIPPKRVVP